MKNLRVATVILFISLLIYMLMTTIESLQNIVRNVMNCHELSFIYMLNDRNEVVSERVEQYNNMIQEKYKKLFRCDI